MPVGSAVQIGHFEATTHAAAPRADFSRVLRRSIGGVFLALWFAIFCSKPTVTIDSANVGHQRPTDVGADGSNNRSSRYPRERQMSSIEAYQGPEDLVAEIVPFPKQSHIRRVDDRFIDVPGGAAVDAEIIAV